MLASMLLAATILVVPEPPPPPPKLFAALSAQYLGGEQFGAGVAYRFDNNITILGQALVGTSNPDSFTTRVCRHSRNGNCQNVTINPTSERNTGFAFTVLIPLK